VYRILIGIIMGCFAKANAVLVFISMRMVPDFMDRLKCNGKNKNHKQKGGDMFF
jgi:hypothetical protein